MNISLQTTASYASVNNSSSKTNGSKQGKITPDVVLGLEVLTTTVLVVIIWTIVSMIIYGTKTRRWRKRLSSSSLSSGAIFGFGTLTITICLCLPITTVLLFQYTSENLPFAVNCEVMGDITVVSHVISSYVIYMFLWRLQRLIYKHSYVRPGIKSWVNWVSRFFCVLITLSAAGLILFYIFPMSFEQVDGGCALKAHPNNSFIDPTYRNALVVPVALINFLVIVLFIYPAARVKFDRQMEGEEADMNRRESLRQRYPTLSYVQKWAHSVAGKAQNTNNSPIEMTVRRGVTSCALIVVIDLISVLVIQASIPVGTPVVVSMSIYNVALLLKIFAMIFSFSFGFAVLKVFVPHCPKSRIRGSKNSMKRESAVTVELVDPQQATV